MLDIRQHSQTHFKAKDFVGNVCVYFTQLHLRKWFKVLLDAHRFTDIQQAYGHDGKHFYRSYLYFNGFLHNISHFPCLLCTGMCLLAHSISEYGSLVILVIQYPHPQHIWTFTLAMITRVSLETISIYISLSAKTSCPQCFFSTSILNSTTLFKESERKLYLHSLEDKHIIWDITVSIIFHFGVPNDIEEY